MAKRVRRGITREQRRKVPTEWVVVHLEIPTWAAVVAVLAALALLIVSLGLVHVGG